jgi:hypothetical protein
MEIAEKEEKMKCRHCGLEQSQHHRIQLSADVAELWCPGMRTQFNEAGKPSIVLQELKDRLYQDKLREAPYDVIRTPEKQQHPWKH